MRFLYVHSASPSGLPSACGFAAGGKYDGHASVRFSSTKMWTVHRKSFYFFFYFFFFANYQNSEHNDFNNEKQCDVYKLHRK